MITLSLFPTKDFSIIDALLISLIAIVLVFLVLVIIILITGGFSKILNKIDIKTQIQPREENKLLEEDNDAVVAALVATIDFHNETKQDANLVSIKRVD